MYKVIVEFADIQDAYHPYHEGDVYPRNGYTSSEERIAELAGTDNLMGVVLIKEEAEKKPATRKRKTATKE